MTRAGGPDGVASRNRQARVGWAATVALVLGLMSGCGGRGISAGPLSAGVDDAGGGATVDRPAEDFKRVVATFGSFILCLQKGAEPATLRAVRARSGAASQFKPYLRTITPELFTATRDRDRRHMIPLGFGLGSPPEFGEPYAAGWPEPGIYSDRIKGATVNETCKQTDAAGLAVNELAVPSGPYTELMIVLPADEKGAEVDGFFVDYTVGGKDYRREVAWDMVVCDRGRQLPGCADHT